MSDLPAGASDEFWELFASDSTSPQEVSTFASPEYQANAVANDLAALMDAGYGTEDVGRRLRDSEMAALTDSSQADVSEAGHIFRGDAQGEMGMPNYRDQELGG